LESKTESSKAGGVEFKFKDKEARPACGKGRQEGQGTAFRGALSEAKAAGTAWSSGDKLEVGRVAALSKIEAEDRPGCPDIVLES